MDSKLKSLFWLNKSKANKKGMAPIYIRIIRGKRKIEVSTGLFTPSKFWNTRKSKVLDGFDLANQINQSLDAYKKRLAQIQTLVLLQDEYIDLKKIKNYLLGISTNDKTLLEAIQYHNEMIASQAGKSFSKNTIKNYHFFRLKIERFLRSEHGISDIPLIDITHIFLEQFITFMIVKDSNGPQTVVKNITLFKKIINMAVSYEWLPKSPFKRLNIDKGSPKRSYLTEEELNIIIHTEIRNKSISKIRDMFLFQCYTGLAFIDLLHLSPRDIVTGIDGNRWIRMQRQKTKSNFAVPLLPPAMDIILKYPGDSLAVFPLISNQKYNSGLKKLMAVTGIGKKIASHAGRRTFATTIALKNGIPIESISRMLGHSNLLITQKYSIVDDLKVAADMSPLFSKFNTPPTDSRQAS